MNSSGVSTADRTAAAEHHGAGGALALRALASFSDPDGNGWLIQGGHHPDPRPAVGQLSR